MADTGAPWNIPYVEPADLVRNYPAANELMADAIAAGLTAANNAGIGSNVVQSVKTDVFSTASTSFVDVNDLTATITPSSDSSKIFVAWSVVISNTANLGATHILITDGSNVALLQGDAAGSRQRTTQGEQRIGDAGEAHVFSGFFLWSPATASAVTAKVRIRAGNNTALVNRTGLDDNSAIGPRTTSSITLMEVAA